MTHFPATPISLNGASSGSAALPKTSIVQIQAALFSTPGNIVHFRIGYGTGLDATALSTAEAYLTAGGTMTLQLNAQNGAYIYWFTTNSAGNATAGGANDYLNIYAQS
jgi:hypothetical protein